MKKTAFIRILITFAIILGLLGIQVTEDSFLVQMRGEQIHHLAGNRVVAKIRNHDVPQATDSFQQIGPAYKVGLQVGHWQNDQVPDELEFLKKNTGARSRDLTETELAMMVAEKTKEILESQGIEVDVLPATVPKRYKADAFISIHADGSKNSSANGFKIAPPTRDSSGKARLLSDKLTDHYLKSTGMRIDANNITTNMTRYYAFSHHKYDHAIHPSTPGALVELGFMTNESDLDLLKKNPEIPAIGIANGVLEFLEHHNS